MAGTRKHRKSQTKSESPIPTTETAETNGNAPAASEAAAEAEKGTVGDKEWTAMQTVLDNLYNAQDDEGEQISYPFHRMINKRSLPDYYELIKRPVAMSTIKAKIAKKTYSSFSEFVEDFAYICHNAQLYNRPEAGAYKYALLLRKALTEELQKLVEDKTIPSDIAELPDLGEIPPPSPQPVQEEAGEEEDDGEDEDDDEDAEEDDSEEETGRKRKRKGPRSTAAIKKREGGPVPSRDEEAATRGDADPRKRRGRPPRVDTPMEARVKAILKGLRKFKNTDGSLKCSHFERLPDKAAMPEYFNEIKQPIALDTIKKKSKRKKYQSVDHFMKDIETMFENAKKYNRDDSPIFKDAMVLQKEARILADQEKSKPDTDFLMDDGRVPLPGIMHNNELYKVGDWVHITNPNDSTKPIVAQLYRTWQDPEGQKWVNACWYYRPEQTVHRAERHFFEKEVVKTGQYRDHSINEVEDKCFVMFFTRFNKGRPRGFPADKEVYVCESRYNEEKHKLNKIKTWASCLPDEVRDKDYEMDLFDQPTKMKKVPSPIAHLLADDAKSDDDIPEPTWASKAAPPLVGAVHKRPREANESPPPEPTPSPPPAPPPVPAPTAPVISAAYPLSAASPTQSSSLHTPSSAQLPQSQQYNQRGQGILPSGQTSIPFSNTYHTLANLGSSHRPPPSNLPMHGSMTPSAGMPTHGGQSHTGGNAYRPSRDPDVLVLSTTENNKIPDHVRALYCTDEAGHVLFFANSPGSGADESLLSVASHVLQEEKSTAGRLKIKKTRFTPALTSTTTDGATSLTINDTAVAAAAPSNGQKASSTSEKRMYQLTHSARYLAAVKNKAGLRERYLARKEAERIAAEEEQRKEVEAAEQATAAPGISDEDLLAGAIWIWAKRLDAENEVLYRQLGREKPPFLPWEKKQKK